ncbi:hypothetical protein [Deinococcus sp.]|uniref:hypothetical protein n=1 Tax=Deinococcus sp. TaxID=47478 RepID=UPI0025FD00F3|nr:hypothetical protein [Deinococcus sp.]
MTGRARRLTRLEAQQRSSHAVEQIGIYEADLAAGVWRDIHTGKAGPALSAEDLATGGELAQSGGGLLLYSPLPGRSKIIPGLQAADL